MQVYKFGGAALADPDGVRRVCDIVQGQARNPLVVVVSAMGKTTNGLEQLARLAATNQQEAALAQQLNIQHFHEKFAAALPNENLHREALQKALDPIYADLGRVVQGLLLLRDFPPRFFDHIMGFGELLSSLIVYHYFRQAGIQAAWLDARDCIRTDSEYQAANVLVQQTQEAIRRHVSPILAAGKVALVQGYIAANAEGWTTTLGREGSDYSAAIFGQALGANAVTIWKDVPGVMNADPKHVELAELLPQLSYAEAVEMTFFGATVIHPKTLKPLRDSLIPLRVRSYLAPEAPGTLISGLESPHPKVPITLVRKGMCLVSVQAQDFRFMDESLLADILGLARTCRLEISLLQTRPLSVEFVCKWKVEQVAQFESEAAEHFNVKVIPNLALKARLNVPPTQPEGHPADSILLHRDDNRILAVYPEAL